MYENFFGDEELKALTSETSTPKLTVETTGNHIYFYAGVDSDRVLNLIKNIRDLDTALRNEQLSRSMKEALPATPIWLHVQSGGGDLFAGFGFADQISMIKTPIYSIVEGYCASAASLITLACTKRYILPNAFMMIHQLRSFMWGKYEEFKDEVKLQDMLMDQMVEFYTKHTRISSGDVRELLKRDSWFNATQCIERGLVDGIL